MDISCLTIMAQTNPIIYAFCINIPTWVGSVEIDSIKSSFPFEDMKFKFGSKSSIKKPMFYALFVRQKNYRKPQTH